MTIRVLKKSLTLNLRNSPLISLESWQSIMKGSNVQTNTITITVHPAVYAKLVGFKLMTKEIWTSAIWDRFIVEDHYEGIGDTDISSISKGDYLLYHGVATDTNEDYWTLIKVTGFSKTGIYALTAIGAKEKYDTTSYNAEEWHQVMNDAAEKNITFATT